MSLSLIVAMSENGVIGRDGQLPWHISGDLRRFKRLTMGHHIVMGRKTYESIGRPLPGRTSIIITRQANMVVEGVLMARGLEESLRMAKGDDEVFVIGGAQIYELALPLAYRIYLTLVHADIAGDTRFGLINRSDWLLVEDSGPHIDSKIDLRYSFQTFERKRTV